MRSFDAVAAEYDAARPAYPDAVYDVLEERAGRLEGRTVADGGAGTGIVSRQLRQRGAHVVAFDPGPGVLRRARSHIPDLRTVICDAAAVALRSHVVDVACFGQSWHWVDQGGGAREVARLLRPGGWWAAWWSHAWADGETWFERYHSLLEAACPGFTRDQRNVDWCADAIGAQEEFDVPERHIVAWQRQVSVDDWLTDLRSHSYIIDMDVDRRAELIGSAREVLQDSFPAGTMVVSYQTRIWMARRD